MTISRREFMQWAGAGSALSLAGCASTGSGPSAGRVVVIGGGIGGGTAASYIKLWAPDIDVTVVERESTFISCPISNLVLAGSTQMSDITRGYGGLRGRGVRVVQDNAVGIDPVNKVVQLESRNSLSYDRLIVSPGVDFLYDTIPGLNNAAAQQAVPHAWKAGAQTLLLRKQLESMRDGGVFVFHIPLAPYRCPPGPYERICQVADYFKRAKPKSKIIVLDSNPDIVSKAGLFRAAWKSLYPGLIDYRPNSELADVDVAGKTVKLQFGDVKGDVLNVVPPQRAGDIARIAGLVNANNRWCSVDWQTCESTAVKGVHVLGDATLSASLMPKSASMANQHGKVCASAVVAMIKGQPLVAEPMMMNTCYSFVDAKNVIHVASVHQYSTADKTMSVVKGSGGLSDKPSEAEGVYAWGWARNIWADSLG